MSCSHLPQVQQQFQQVNRAPMYVCKSEFLLLSCLIGKLPDRRDKRGSRVDRHGFVISSSSDGATYVNP